MVKDFESATSMISNDLNHEQMHFLLELIQNSADVNYGLATSLNDTPTFQMEVCRATAGERTGSIGVRTVCNEDGFTEANVRSICRLSASSKKAAPDRKRIGEKGIGFKVGHASLQTCKPMPI